MDKDKSPDTTEDVGSKVEEDTSRELGPEDLDQAAGGASRGGDPGGLRYIP